jgi:hypothetical protein
MLADARGVRDAALGLLGTPSHPRSASENLLL